MSIGKPSEKEEEYFARKEFERRRQEAQERVSRQAEDEKRRLREQHWMHCPKCGMDLVEVQMKDVRVDKCTGCDGIWLDAGEIDTLLGKDGGHLSSLLRIFR